MEYSIETLPEAVSHFIAALEEKLPNVKRRIEAGGEKAGNWWIDLIGINKCTVEWRPAWGFGLFLKQRYSYGEGPTEIFQTPERAAHRVAQFLASRNRDASGLRAIREICGITQEQIASKLRIRQEAISRLESRRDSRVETIERFVGALGGHVEMWVRFPDCQMAIYPKALSIPLRRKASKGKHGTIKSSRLARA